MVYSLLEDLLIVNDFFIAFECTIKAFHIHRNIVILSIEGKAIYLLVNHLHDLLLIETI